jgi:hypothetical protein
LLLYLRVRWRPLSGISLLTEFGDIPLTAVITFPERTDVVLGRSRGDFGSVLLVARGMPLGDGTSTGAPLVSALEDGLYRRCYLWLIISEHGSEALILLCQ